MQASVPVAELPQGVGRLLVVSEMAPPSARRRAPHDHTVTLAGRFASRQHRSLARLVRNAAVFAYQPASFVVIETVRAKYACPHCHESADLSRATLCDGVADVAAALTPIGDQLHREITAADYLQTDDTTVTVLEERGGSYKGRRWTYLDPLHHHVVFEATPTHDRDGPATFLEPLRGKLQADAQAGYDGLGASGRVVEIGCWAHARRWFVEAVLTDGSAALMVALIQQLYQVERPGADRDPDARRTLRQEQSLPLLAQIDAQRQVLAQTVRPKSPFGDAVRYLTNQWAALQRFTEDGRLAIDNNR